MWYVLVLHAPTAVGGISLKASSESLSVHAHAQHHNAMHVRGEDACLGFMDWQGRQHLVRDLDTSDRETPLSLLLMILQSACFSDAVAAVESFNRCCESQDTPQLSEYVIVLARAFMQRQAMLHPSN